MDLSKSYEFFKPEICTAMVHIVGCGSVGSAIAENLARCGIENITLWDFDLVEPHNVANQMFTALDIGKPKTSALAELLKAINPDMRVIVKESGWKGETLSGYVFLAVDKISVRNEIVDKHMWNPSIKAVFDVRTLLTGAQHYAADWSDIDERENLKKSMDFTDEEADAEVPMSACGAVLGVVTTVRVISAIAVNNFIRFLKGEGIWKYVTFEGFNNPEIMAF